MGRTSPKLDCPECGEPMNCHARKRSDPVNAAEARMVDPELGGILREVHACPGCGAVAARLATPGS